MAGREYEIIVVNDGSNDRTVDVVLGLEDNKIRVVNNPGNKGKGFAVRNGMLNARGNVLLFSDADLSTPISELDNFLPLLERGYDVVFGSRAMKHSNIEVHQPRSRELMGKLYNKIVRATTISGIKDTQCGFKLFTKDAANKIFNLQKLDGFSFDVEILYLAKKCGFQIKEVPVTWINNPDTKINSVKDSAKMFVDLLKIRWLHERKKI